MSAEFSDDTLELVHGRSAFVCEMCGESRAEENHHRRPRGSGGTRQAASAEASNCLHTCRDCHRLAESHRNLARACGWLVPQGANPASWAVVYRGHRVLLDDEGGFRAVGAAA